MFSLELLQAINDWQRGGDAPTKRKQGARLKELALSLPRNFREVKARCYRRLALAKGPGFDLGERLALPEAISAWTLDLAVAKEFKHGVPEPGRHGVIFQLSPEPGQFVVSLDSLYSDHDFRRECETMKDRVKHFAEGIGRYGNSQREVVLEVTHITIDSVIALGGFAPQSQIDSLAQECLGRPLSDEEAQAFEDASAHARGVPGDWWLMGDGKDRVVEKWKRDAQRLAPRREEERRGR
jgi:hypothetical protein